MNQYEKAIREKRTIAATKKNLMGPTGKLGTILKAYGQPVVCQSGGLYDVSYLPEMESYDEYEYGTTVSGQRGPIITGNEILLDEDGESEIIGFIYDGLNQGLHLEIRHMIDTNSLSASFKGFQVYEEVAGDLTTYVPNDLWEEPINRLYRSAKDVLEKRKPYERQEIIADVEKKKERWLEKMRRRWGI